MPPCRPPLPPRDAPSAAASPPRRRTGSRAPGARARRAHVAPDALDSPWACGRSLPGKTRRLAGQDPSARIAVPLLKRRDRMNVYEPGNIRNVLLVGHSGTGKTTLLEAMLFTAGGLTRMGTVEDGNTVSDHDPEETHRGISVSLAMAPVEWDGVKVNVLDAPGYADFIDDVKSAIRAADCCIFV